VSSRPAVSKNHPVRAQLSTSSVFFASTVAGVLLCVLATGVLAQSPADSPPQPAATQAEAVYDPWRTDRFYLETSLYTHHFHYDAAHVDKQKLILGEWNITEQWLVGASFFDNSFGQPTQYIYGGWRYRPFEQAQSPYIKPFYIKLSAGIVHGYKDPYQDKIPFNHSGVAPGFVPSVGYCINRFCSELILFGGAGMLITLGVTIP
jgi:hypothetical protein